LSRIFTVSLFLLKNSELSGAAIASLDFHIYKQWHGFYRSKLHHNHFSSAGDGYIILQKKDALKNVVPNAATPHDSLHPG
jgi:hypothetical protein